MHIPQDRCIIVIYHASFAHCKWLISIHDHKIHSMRKGIYRLHSNGTEIQLDLCFIVIFWNCIVRSEDTDRNGRDN